MEPSISKGYVVFSRELASELIKKGFEMINMRTDKKDNSKKVYVFKDDGVLREFVRHYTQATGE